MLAKYPVFNIARLVLETCTPLSISTGRGDSVFDTVLVRDANGLPTIPGSSLAGVLRHLYEYEQSKETTQALFGDAERNYEKPSQVYVSWGCLHDSHDRPVEGLVFDNDRLDTDPLLMDARNVSLVRNHVRLTHRGTAADQGQFDRSSLRTGHRFSVELALWSAHSSDERWKQLLILLSRPDFRLGGATRRGLGSLRVVRLYDRQFDLRKADDFDAYRALPVTLVDKGNLKEQDIPKLTNFPQAKIELTPRDGYRFGQGTEPFGNERADLLAVREKRVNWDKNGCGSVGDERFIVIPASAIKGALSHRVAFHYNALTKCFADTLETKDKPYDKAENPAIQTLFGFAKENNEGGKVGHLLLDDAYLQTRAEQAITLMHNSVDRFTGGVRKHVLFSEQLVGQKDKLELLLTVVPYPKNPRLNEPEIRQALQMALCDLVEGRLALGAGGGRGHGYFQGTVTWLDGGAWITGDADGNT